MGTTGIGFRGHWYKLPYTTPLADRFQGELRALADAGARAVATEVSSHALATERTYGTRFRVIGFTNLTRDHLDFHGDETSYRESKLRLFDRAARGDDEAVVAVVNIDDPAAGEFVSAAKRSGDRVVTTGRRGIADVHVESLEMDVAGSRCDIRILGRRYQATLALPGAFNVDNALTALAMAVEGGVDPETAIAGIEGVNRIPGRLERVDRGGPVSVLVDFAHTPDALETVLTAVRAFAAGRLIAVFGCGGDRDRGKRPQMAAVGTRIADHSILTSDNPRSEDPQTILDEMLAGVVPGSRVEVEPDRRRAIRRAIHLADPGDVVVIAGKGHETVQLIGDRELRFDDREEAVHALRDADRLGESR
jgi:UDP-N-acetylmuramoyl-L-alanyl-D-glutamate--2,6-diaminopimelate ligase